jgi:hypothetical protein
MQLRARWQLQRMGFTGELTYAVSVPPGPAGRPGERVFLPSRSPYVGVISADDSRSDFAAFLSRNGSAIVVAMLNREASAAYTLKDGGMRTLRNVTNMGAGVAVSDPQPDTMLGHEAVRFTYRLNSGLTVTDWNLIRDGWLYMIGLHVVRKDQPQDVQPLFRAVLNTWAWSPGTCE